MVESVVLLPSVLLGPASLGPLGAELTARGRSVVVADTAGATTPAEVAARYRAASPGEPAAWVAHSNAGLYLPALLGERPDDVGVLVDAALPGPAPAASAAGERLDALRQLADPDGLLPAWDAWWGPQRLAALLPDARHRQALAESAPRLPLSYFTTPVPVPADGGTEARLAWLSFDGPYASDREAMAAAGRPTRHLPGGHLSPLTQPARVAAAIEELIGRLRAP
ncbi:hypothetical protein RM844_13640 [Streptomyces sp. DSM 44915]|uniref:Alpha/beta hydrolase n=1 Tax=Streptomyces chisholmiae TaxID=3075540 RepID=A0ABU2JRF5_9ACTN|nr:hypothetical protein [Streptomyces sp. DSM 44915]MDT0267328.1 hypothetical protein [Streptomyces sp. DSM 44915]